VTAFVIIRYLKMSVIHLLWPVTSTTRAVMVDLCTFICRYIRNSLVAGYELQCRALRQCQIYALSMSILQCNKELVVWLDFF
jgi:hypothetical protein